MNFSEWSAWSLIPWSSRWLLVADLLCLLGVALAAGSAFRHYHVARRRLEYRPGGFTPLIGVLVAATGCVLVALWHRGIEVNHFPSQTMGEVLTVFCLSLLVSVLVLHYAMGIHRRGPGWAILDDVLIGVVLAGVVATTFYIRTLPTSQRDLPPALQSYWFAPHIAALVFSYATLGIAGILCTLWFASRFWVGIFAGGRSWRSQALVLALLCLVPFAQVVTFPILLLSGLFFWLMHRDGRLPAGDGLMRLERDLDEVSFRAFAVGIPFLTAGLWMGSFWAQEAWANYWGWDSKENSALITWLVYIAYFHLRMLGGYRGEKAMAVLMGGALSIFLTFQIFGYLPDSQKNSLHKYTDDAAPPMEGQQGPNPNAQARASD
jgi:ABC-type transport system involved in cytochrome c biogenesis permease subunit